MLGYVAKLIHTVLPSVVATVLGAYLVNFYILPKATGNVPPAAISTPATPAPETPKPVSLPSKPAEIAPPKPADIKASETSSRAKASEKQAEEKRRLQEKTAEKTAEDARKAQARDKAEKLDKAEKAEKAAKADKAEKAAAHTPAAAPQAAPAKVVVAPAASDAPVDAALSPEQQNRDANDLARAAIDRLRAAKEPATDAEPAAPVEASAPPQVPVATPVAVATPAPAAMQPLPPAITVNEPEPYVARRESGERERGEARADNSGDPRPPAGIPEGSEPIQLHNEARRPNVAEDMLSAAKSVFQSVIPGR